MEMSDIIFCYKERAKRPAHVYSIYSTTKQRSFIHPFNQQ